MTKNEIREMAKNMNITLEDAKKYRKDERTIAKKEVVKAVKAKYRNSTKEHLEKASFRANNAAIMTEVIAMRKQELKELKKNIKKDTKIQKKIEKELNKIEKRNEKIAEMSKKMNINAATC